MQVHTAPLAEHNSLFLHALKPFVLLSAVDSPRMQHTSAASQSSRWFRSALAVEETTPVVAAVTGSCTSCSGS